MPQFRFLMLLFAWISMLTLATRVVAADRVLIRPGSGSIDDVRNGGFESEDNGQTHYTRWGKQGARPSEFWTNYRFSQQRAGRSVEFSPPEGKYCGIVNSVNSGPHLSGGAEPSVNTGYRIQPGDQFTLSFKYAGATGWTPATRLQIVASLYFDHDGDDHDGKDNVIDHTAVTPATNASDGDAYLWSGNRTLRSNAASVGKTARLRFQTSLDRNIFAAIDDVKLTVVSGESSGSSLVTSRRGDLPIILSAPHGGRSRVPGVPRRQGVGIKKFNSKSDSNTDRLTELLADAIETKTGRAPYVVIARFHRRYIDANRPRPLAYESSQAQSIYDAYHQALARARGEVIERWGHGMLLDIHGQAADPKAIIRGTQNGKTTTHLLSRFGQPALRGESGLFGRLAKQGFPVVPSVGSRDREHDKYDGGYIVVTYGSGAGGTVDAIQLELGKDLRLPETLESTATRIAAAAAEFAQDFLPKKERPPSQ